MADKDKKDEVKIEVPQKLLTEMQEKMAAMELKIEEQKSAQAGLEEMVAKNVETKGENKLKEKKDFEPTFRTVKIKKYPIAGDVDNLGYVVGWTNRGAYQGVKMTSLGNQLVDYIDLIFLGHEKNNDGKLQAEKVELLDFMNKGVSIHCKILDKKEEKIKVPTGEEIDVSVFDPAHGLVATGDKVDGYSAFTDIKYKIQIPGVSEPVWIDALYCNA